MRKNLNSCRGITLIALTITIIVLLILIGITIGSINDNNSIINKGSQLQESSRMKTLEEELEIIAVSVKNTNNFLTADEYLEKYKEAVEKNELFQNPQKLEIEGYELHILTEEGYYFKVTEDDIKYLADGEDDNDGDDDLPNLEPGDIKFTLSDNNWTNRSIYVEITIKQGYTLEYSMDGQNWLPYNSRVKVDQNGTIYARGKSSSGEIKGSSSYPITNIDKLEPNEFTPSIDNYTTNSITVYGKTTDQNATSANGKSDIKSYYFSIDNGSTWVPTNGQNSSTYTFTGLTQDETYSIKVKAIDNAGNPTISSGISQKTEIVPGGNTNITFAYSTDQPTNKGVDITISANTSQFTLEYSTDGKVWNPYTKTITTTINTAIYARLKDSTGQVGSTATGNVANIDTLLPNSFTPTASNITTNSLTLSGSTTDQAKTETSASSGIKAYYFSKDNGSTWVSNNGQSSYTFTGLSQGQSYTLKMKAVDNASNEFITDPITQAVQTVPGGNANITFGYNPSGWTSGNVAVTITPAKTGFTLEYSLNSTTWNTYNGPVTMTSNGAIYARLKDSTGQIGGTATGNVTNIDKTAPICTLSQANNNVEYEKRINVNCYDNESGVVLKKFAPGSRNAAYFANNGTTFTGNYFTAKTSQSGGVYDTPAKIYTVYSKNAVGLETVTTINITNLYFWNTLTYNNGCLAVRKWCNW